MGLDVCVTTDLPVESIPSEYRQYIDLGIKGWWLKPYVSGFGYFDEGVGDINIYTYIINHLPSWKDVQEHLKEEYPEDYETVWTEADHICFINALLYFYVNDRNSSLAYSC